MNTIAIEKAKTNQLLSKILEIDWNAAPVTPEEARILEHLDDNLNKQVNAYVNWLESDEGREALINSANREVEIFDNIREDIRQIYRETGNNVNEVIERIYQAGEAKGYNDIRQIRVYTEASKYALQFLKDYNFELIKNASDDFVDMIQEEIFVGMASGLHPYQIANNLLNSKFEVPKGMTLTPMQRARMIARTETARAQTTGTLQAYANYGVEEIDVIPAHDNRVCAICLENEENNPHPLDSGSVLVPAHPNCRCAVAAHIRHNEELKFDEFADPVLSLEKLKEKIKDMIVGEVDYDKKISPDFFKLTKPQDIADYFEYELYKYVELEGVPGTFYKFYDRKNDCSIFVEVSNLGYHGLLRFDDKNGNFYNLRDIILMCDVVPDRFKKLTKSIRFLNWDMGKYRGENFIDNEDNICINIYKEGLKVFSPGKSTQRTIFHEFVHGWARGFIDGIAINNSPEYGAAVEVEGFISEQAENFHNKNENEEVKFAEDIAESGSVMLMKKSPIKDCGYIILPNGEHLTYDDFYIKFQYKSKIFRGWWR